MTSHCPTTGVKHGHRGAAAGPCCPPPGVHRVSPRLLRLLAPRYGSLSPSSSSEGFPPMSFLLILICSSQMPCIISLAAPFFSDDLQGHVVFVPLSVQVVLRPQPCSLSYAFTFGPRSGSRGSQGTRSSSSCPRGLGYAVRAHRSRVAI